MDSYENFYPGVVLGAEQQSGFGTYSDLFTGYRVEASRIGTTLNPSTANQLAELTRRLNTGVKVVEMGTISPDVFEAIPKQHFKTVEQLSKLTGSKVTLHAPLIAPYGWAGGAGLAALREEFRKVAQEYLWNVVEKGHAMGAPVITIHSATEGLGPVTRKVNGKEEVESIPVVDNTTGKIIGYIGKEEIVEPTEGKEEKVKVLTPEENIERYNRESLRGIVNYYLSNLLEIKPLIEYKEEWEKRKKELGVEEAEPSVPGHIKLAELRLQSLVRDFIDRLPTLQKVAHGDVRKEIVKMYKLISECEQQPCLEKFEKVLNNLAALSSRPDIGKKMRFYVPAEEVALKYSAETLANLATKAYENFGEDAPTLSIENVYPDMGLSRAKILRQLIDEARHKFVERNKSRLGESNARKIAEKLIGVTWDLGHINMLKKYGYTDEDILAETKEIAKFIKHVHVSDNFGFTDTHLPASMGNVPFKQAIKEIEKQSKEKPLLVHEAGSFINFFKLSDVPYVLEAFGSPLYTYMQAPFWNQFGHTIPGYFGSFEYVFPETHTYGFGFSALPAELGGQARGGQGFSQAPME